MFSSLKLSCNERWRSLLKIMKFLHICTFHLANICIIKIRIFQLKHQFFWTIKLPWFHIKPCVWLYNYSICILHTYIPILYQFIWNTFIIKLQLQFDLSLRIELHTSVSCTECPRISGLTTIVRLIFRSKNILC